MAQLKTFTIVGQRESLEDKIYRITPEDTPFMSNGGRGSVDQVFFEWQTDALASVDLTNAQLQGAAANTFATLSPTRRIGNRTQISNKVISVSGTAEATRKAGRKSELAFHLAKKSVELRKDMEAIVIGQHQIATTGDATHAYKTASLSSFVFTNVVNGGGAAHDPSYASSTQPDDIRVDGTLQNITEALFKQVLTKCYNSGANIQFAMFGPVNKQNASKFAGIAQLRRDANGGGQASIVAAADVYIGDFGKVSFVPNRLQRDRDVWFLDRKMYSFVYLRPFETIKLAKVGDSEDRLLQVEWGLKVNNEAGLGLLADLNTAILP
jgi:hypothetical protein